MKLIVNKLSERVLRCEVKGVGSDTHPNRKLYKKLCPDVGGVVKVSKGGVHVLRPLKICPPLPKMFVRPFGLKNGHGKFVCI